MEEILQQILQKLSQIESDMKNLKVGQESLKKDLQELKEGQSRISAVIYKRNEIGGLLQEREE